MKLNCFQEYRDIKITQGKHKFSYFSTRNIQKEIRLITYLTLSYGAGTVTESVHNVFAASAEIKKANHIRVRMKRL